MQLHNISRDITAGLPRPAGPVLTLAPLYALEGQCRIYPQLVAGPFVYRVADSLTDKDREITNTVGPDTLEQLIAQNPPSAIIVGTEQAILEDALIEIALSRNWRKQNYPNGITVYLPP